MTAKRMSRSLTPEQRIMRKAKRVGLSAADWQALSEEERNLTVNLSIERPPTGVNFIYMLKQAVLAQGDAVPGFLKDAGFCFDGVRQGLLYTNHGQMETERKHLELKGV